MAISQIIFGQYHIWDIIGLGVKNKVSCGKNNVMIEIMNTRLTAPKWALIDSLALKYPPNPKFVRPICPIGSSGYH